MSALRTTLAVATALTLTLGLSVAGRARDPAPAQASSGADLYKRFGCYECHGYAGQGSQSTGATLAGRGFTVDHVISYTRKPKGVMPPYRAAVLSDADLARIATYIVGMPGPKPIAQIPALARLMASRQAAAIASGVKPGAAPAGERGGAIFAQHCASCHGARGEGGIGPGLLGEAGKRTLDQTVALILSPPPAMPKLAPNPIPTADLPAVAGFVRSLGAPAKLR